MILVDTNVVSEPMKLSGDGRVVAWLNAQAVETLFISAVSVSELLLGVEAMPMGRRREALAGLVSDAIANQFGDRILPFDFAAARLYATIVAAARRKGFSISVSDGQIAATAAAHRLSVATRDGAPFRAAGLEVIDPWTEGAA